MDYTDLYNFQTSTGIIVPNDASVLEGIQQKFQEIFGADIDLSAETPVGRLIEAFAVMVKTTLGVTAQTANQFNINEATGIYLDAIAQIYDLQRVSGTRTNITIQCYFSDNDGNTVIIPAGSLIMSPSTGKTFSIDEAISSTDAINDGEGQKYSIGTATAVEDGPIVAPTGTVTAIQSRVAGWIGVRNVSPSYTGTDKETDEEFRRRIRNSRPVGIGFDTHLIAALNRLEGVNSNCVLENNTGTSKVEKGITIPAHSIYVCVDCVASELLLHEIAHEISRAKPVGVGMVSSTAVPATPYSIDIKYGYADTLSQTINFYLAKKTTVQVSITYSFGKYVGDDIETDIRRTTSAYIGSVGVGGIIYGTMLANELITKLNIGIGTIMVQRVGGDPADSSVEMMGYEMAICPLENITIIQIA